MEEKRPLISVIVPVYKVEEYLPACIDSILAQTYENLEIILIDDGSPDNCGKICDEYAKKDSRIRVIHKENGGVSSARNKGLDTASGELIGFVDSDDTLHPEMYEKLYKNLTETKADIVSCSFTRCYSPDEKGEEDAEEERTELSSEEALCSMLHRKHFGAHVWCKLFKAETVKNVRFDRSISISEDVPFVAEAILNSQKFTFFTGRLYNYLQRQGSALNSAFGAKNMTSYDALLKVVDLGNSYSVSEKTKASIQAVAALTCIHMAYEIIHQKEAAKKYIPIIRKNIRKHISPESLAHLNRSRQRQARLLAVSYPLFKLFFRLAKAKKAS